MAHIPVALQLYTVRDHTATDFVGTVEKVAAMGYKGVELAGMGGMTPEALKALLDRLNLKPVGAHIGMDQLESRLDEVIAEQKVIGNKWIVCPWIGEDRRADAAGWKATAAAFNKIGAKCKEQGMVFCYHNHAFEFQKFDGEYGLDILYGASDPALVFGEIDCYWVQKGGESPAAYLKKYASRVPLVHLKDMANDAEGSFTEVGNGVLDFPAIFAAAEAGIAEWYIVEQDRCAGDSLDSARISAENLKRMGKL